MIRPILGHGAAALFACAALLAQTPTSTTVAPQTNGIGVGLPLTIQATVTPAPPSGKVTFYDRTSILGTVTLNASGEASFTTTDLLPGSHRLRALFIAGGGFASSFSGYSEVSVWSSPSSGFLTGQLYTVPNWTGYSENEETLTADLNGDGKPDVVVASVFGIAVFIGQGFGKFVPPVEYTTTTLINGLALADIRGTGYQDIVAFNSDQEHISFFWNNGGGEFTVGTPLQIGTIIGDMKIADFNRDGIPDLVFISDAIYLALGNGDGTFQSPYPVLRVTPPLLGGHLAVADFDQDGDPDIAFAPLPVYDGDTQWGVLWGEGGGHFTAPAYFGPSSGYPLMAYDVNRDGKPDLIFGFQVGIEVALGDGNRTFAPVVQYGVDNLSLPPDIVPVDLNGDGKPDLALFDGRYVIAFYGNGDGTFQPASIVSPEISPSSGAAADFNSDGRMDLVVPNAANGVSNLVRILYGAKPPQ